MKNMEHEMETAESGPKSVEPPSIKWKSREGRNMEAGFL